jgi:hypothetical protein
MGRARFLIVVGSTRHPRTASWPGADGLVGHVAPDGGWAAWRLLGANNRELGRSPEVFADPAACLADLRAVCPTWTLASPVLAIDTRTNLWRWRLQRDDRSVAVSARAYLRQRECQYSLAHFLGCAMEVGSDGLTGELAAPPLRARVDLTVSRS